MSSAFCSSTRSCHFHPSTHRLSHLKTRTLLRWNTWLKFFPSKSSDLFSGGDSATRTWRSGLTKLLQTTKVLGLRGSYSKSCTLCTCDNTSASESLRSDFQVMSASSS